MAETEATCTKSLAGMCALCTSEFEHVQSMRKRFDNIADSDDECDLGPFAFDDSGRADNILHYSVTMGHLHCVNIILDSASVDINQPTKGSGHTPLMIASKKGFPQIVKALIAKGANVHTLDRREEDALMFAVGANHCDCATILMKEGAIFDRRNKFHRSALVVATDAGNVQCMRLLIERGAKFDLFGPYNAMIWVIFGLRMSALSPSVIEDVLMLIVQQAGVLNMHLFEAVVHKDCPDLLRNILDKDIVIKGNRGEDHPTFFGAIVRAIENGFAPNVRLLLQYKVKLRLKLNDYFRDIDGKTVLQIACEQNIDDIVQALLEHGADPNLSGRGPKAQRTPLFICLRSLSYNEYGLQFITSLIKHGCDVERKCFVNLRGVDGHSAVTPLDYALYGRNLLAAQILVEAGANNYNPVFGGNRPHKSLVHKKLECTQQEVGDFVKSHLSGPISLYDCSRMAIRKILGSHVSSAVEELPVARHVQESISYDTMDRIAQNFKTSMSKVGIQPREDDMTEVSIESNDDNDSLESDADSFDWDISDVSDNSSDDEDYRPSDNDLVVQDEWILDYESLHNVFLHI